MARKRKGMKENEQGEARGLLDPNLGQFGVPNTFRSDFPLRFRRRLR